MLFTLFYLLSLIIYTQADDPLKYPRFSPEYNPFRELNYGDDPYEPIETFDGDGELPQYTSRCFVDPVQNVVEDRHKRDIFCLPDAVCIGEAKCGTSFLWTHLQKHPQIQKRPVKENRFSGRISNHINFAKKFPYRGKSYSVPTGRPMKYSTDEPFRNRYKLAYFKNPKKIQMDDTPSYLHRFPDFSHSKYFEFNKYGYDNSDYVRSIRTYYPSGNKILVILCDPTLRAHSQYVMWKNLKSGAYASKNANFGDFHEVVIRNIEEIKACYRQNQGTKLENTLWGCKHVEEQWPYYVRNGIYDYALFEWLKQNEEILVILKDDIHFRPQETLHAVTSFLGLHPYNFSDVSTPVHVSNCKKGTKSCDYPLKSGEEKHVLKPETIDLLDDFFEPLNERLEDMIGRKLPWGKKRGNAKKITLDHDINQLVVKGQNLFKKLEKFDSIEDEILKGEKGILY